MSGGGSGERGRDQVATRPPLTFSVAGERDIPHGGGWGGCFAQSRPEGQPWVLKFLSSPGASLELRCPLGSLGWVMTWGWVL
jgi:hypothetical protein